MEKSQYNDFWKFIKLLHDNDLLKHIVLIGSWAEYLYSLSGILLGFTSNLKTLDIDFLILNMRKPARPVSIIALAKESGYTIDHDVLYGTTKIYTPDLMEIEFLISQSGCGAKPVIETNLGVNAQALRHISLLREQTIIVNCFNLQITIPLPEAYIAQKISVNNMRGKKAEKDRQAITAIMPYLDRDKFKKICDGMSKKEQKVIDEFIKIHNL